MDDTTPSSSHKLPPDPPAPPPTGDVDENGDARDLMPYLTARLRMWIVFQWLEPADEGGAW